MAADRRSVVISLTTTRREHLTGYLNRVVESGDEAVLVCGWRGPWEPLPPEVTVVELLDLERRTLWYRFLAWWLVRARGLWLLAVALLYRVLAKLSRGRVSTVFRWRAKKRNDSYRALSGRRHPAQRWLSGPKMRLVRPWLFWRTLRRRGLGTIDIVRVTDVVWGDDGSWPIAWQLARRSGARVHTFSDV